MTKQLMPTMTLQLDDWKLAELIELYGEDDTVEEDTAKALANTFVGWVNKLMAQEDLVRMLEGWSYDSHTGTFTGPGHSEALSSVMQLVTDAADYTSVE